MFYDGEEAPSGNWLNKVRHNWKSLGPYVSAARIVNEYDERLYRPDRVS